MFDAIARTCKEEGFTNMWRGSTPTVCRAMAMNFGMLGPYDSFKDFMTKKYGDFNGLRFLSSLYAAFWAAFFCMPFDNVKTKI